MDEPIASTAPGPPPPAVPDRPRRLWRDFEDGRKASARRVFVVAALLALATASALILTVGWFRPVSRPALVLVGDAPGRPASPISVPYEERDRRALAGLGGFFPVIEASPDDGIPASAAVNESSSSLVVLVSARAWIAPSPGDPGRAGPRFSRGGAIPAPGRPAEGLTLGELLRSVGSKKAARKLVILDILPPPDDPRLGAGSEDLGAAVAAEAGRAVEEFERISILTSCGPGQRPRASEALGRSVFGYFLERGLKGDADGSGDGRVTVRELAAYLSSEVDAWTRQVFGARQTPSLHEVNDQGDFPLTLVDRRSPRPAAILKEVPAYPAWLLDGWRGRDEGRAAGLDRDAPRAFDQLDAALLLAERGWREKLDEPRLRVELAGRSGRLRERIESMRAIPHPRPRSLALEASFGGSPDPDALKAVRDAVAKRARPTPDAKAAEVDAANARLIAEFALSAKVQGDFGPAEAAFRVAAEDASPTRDVLAFLDRLLGALQPRPVYVETLTLRRLAEAPASAWSPEVARLALALARRGEALEARPAATFGSSRPLDEAARLRHEAEVAAASPGYTAPGEPERRLNQALVATDAAATRASTIEEARRMLDEAMTTLPVATPLVDLDDLERSWFAAVGSAGSLADLLAKPEGDDEGRFLDDLGERSGALRGLMAAFGARAIARRVARLTRPDAVLGPADLREVDALLATPLPLAQQRAALWKVGIDLGRRLAEAALRPDGRAATSAPEIEVVGAGTKSRGARVSAALLALSGRAGAGWAELVGFVGGKGGSVEGRDRAGRLVSPWVDLPAQDEPATNDTRARRLAQFARLRSWLADRYAFEARDPGPSDFFAEASRDFSEPGDPPRATLRIAVEPASASLDVEHPEATIRLGLRPSPPLGSAVVEVATADGDWLEVRAGPPGPKATRRVEVPLGSESAEVPVTVTLRPESDATRAPIPPGVLARIRWQGRTYHRRLPLRIEPESRRPRLILAASPSAPAPAVAEVRLRATQGKVPYSIHVENPGDRDRRFVVELAHRGGPIAGARTSLTIKAGETSRVTFGPPAANPDGGFLDLQGALSILLTDADDPGLRVARSVPVGLAAPTDLVRVVAARYEPPGTAGGGKGRLEFTLKAVGPIEGPPCPVELSMPVDRIPGLVSVGEGTFRARLEKAGDEATLFVEDFDLDPRADESGHVHLAIDGVERALVYRVRFARRGGPTIPARETSPAVRLKAGRVASTTAPLRVGVELDSPPEAGRLKLALGQYTATGPGDRFRADAETFDDSSRGRVRLNPRGPDGSLLFEAAVRDPSVTFDVGRVRGRRLIRALLLDERGDVKGSDELPLVLDDRAPSSVGFEALPKYGLRGGSVSLKATGKVPESGIKEVAFFAGRPVNGKRPAAAAVVPGKPVGAGSEAWTASLPLVDARVGPLDVSVEFVSGVGQSRFDTATISVVEAIPTEPGTIRGAVREGGRPQPGLEVRVYDEKGVETGKATTDDRGRFEVSGLAPKAYEVVSARATPPTRGTARTVVKAGAITEVDVPMYRAR